IVLGAERDVQRAGPGARHERGRQIGDAALDAKAGGVELVGQPAGGTLLLERQLRMPMDAPAERDQPVGRAGDPLPRAILRIHGPRFRVPGSPASSRAGMTASMYDGLLVVDADAHKMENPVLFFDYLDPRYRERLSSRTDRHGQPRLVI